MLKKKSVKWAPVLDRVMVRPDPEGDMTTLQSGIVVPTGKDNRLKEGTVAATGPGRHSDGQLIPVGVKPGDRVLYLDKTGWNVVVDGEAHIILDEGALMAKG